MIWVKLVEFHVDGLAQENERLPKVVSLNPTCIDWLIDNWSIILYFDLCILLYFILRLSCWVAFCQLVINEYCIVLCWYASATVHDQQSENYRRPGASATGVKRSLIPVAKLDSASGILGCDRWRFWGLHFGEEGSGWP